MAKQKIKDYLYVNGKWSFFRTKEFLRLVIILLIALIIIILLQSFKFKHGKVEYDPVIKDIHIKR